MDDDRVRADLFRAALKYAEAGRAVLVVDAAKRPVWIEGLAERGVKDATTEADKLARWLRHPDAAGIAITCAGLMVLDADRKPGKPDGLAWIEAHAAGLPPTREHTTPTGAGRHLIYADAVDGPVLGGRRWRAQLAPGVDVKAGAGCYVVVPPSPGYAVARACRPVPAPAWVAERARHRAPPEAVPPMPAMRPAGARDMRPGAAVALHYACEAIRRAGVGSRFHTLRSEAYGLGRRVGAGWFAEGDARAELLFAVRAMPLDPSKRESHAWAEAFALARFAEGVRNPRTDGPPLTHAERRAEGRRHG